MELFLIRLGNMSFQAAIIICVILAVRFLFAKMNIPKKYACLLWVIPFFCMICPWKIESDFGLLGETTQPFHVEQIQTVEKSMPEESIVSEPTLAEKENTGYPYSEPDSTQREEVQTSNAILGTVLFGIWLLGAAVLFFYSVISCLKLKKKLVCSICMEENIYFADDIDTPFVFGLINPGIYLPSNMREQELKFVIAHERTHIKRKDYLVKVVAFLVVVIHWFNPFAWAAFYFLGKDMEMSCDEQVIKQFGGTCRKEYAQALLKQTVRKRKLSGIPLAFGEGSTKDRIVNILKDKKPLWLAVCAAVFILAGLAVGFLTGRKETIRLSAAEEMIVLPEAEKVEKIYVYKDGNITEFSQAYGESFLKFIRDLKVKRTPVSRDRSSERCRDIWILFSSGIGFYFCEDGGEVWCYNNLEPSYTYQVVKPDEVLEFLENQLGSIEPAAPFGYMGYEGYLDECTGWTDYQNFLDMDYDGDGLADRVCRLLEENQDFCRYRIDFGNGDLLEFDKSVPASGIPHVEAADLTGDGTKEILFTLSYDFATDPMALSHFAVFRKQGMNYECVELPFHESEDSYAWSLWMAYETEGDRSLRISCQEPLFEMTVPIEEVFWEDYQYAERYPGNTFEQWVWKTELKSEDGETKLECRIGLLDRWNISEAVVTVGYRNGKFIIEKIEGKYGENNTVSSYKRS